MLGPLLQGVMFVGVLYWYSKGIFSLINDYYRDEFKAYMEKDPRKELRLKPSQLASDSEAVHIEGLPDILKSSSEFSKVDGVITRDADQKTDKWLMSLISSRQCKLELPTTSGQILNVDDKNDAICSSQLSNAIKLDYVPTSIEDDEASECESTDNDDMLILNPSVANKLNYRQMANQQVSDINDGKLTETVTRTMALKLNCNGNCFKNDERTNAEKFSVVGNLEIPMMSQMPRKIPVNGVATNFKEANSNICRRKSVNEMIQFWSNYQELIKSEAKSSEKKRTMTTARFLNSDKMTPNS